MVGILWRMPLLTSLLLGSDHFSLYLVKNKETRIIRSKSSQTSLRKSMCRKHTIELQTQTYEIMKPFFLFSIDFKMVIILKGFDQIYDFYDCILAWIIRA